MRKAFKIFLWFVVATVILPIAVATAMGLAKGWPDSWKAADWSSSGLLPQAAQSPEATVIILASRTGRWKGIFAEHMSLVLKPKGAARWTRYDVVGWGAPVRRNAYAADAFWYSNAPRIIYRLTGPQAAALIPDIEKAIASYPYRSKGTYTVWPGPNSNTFVSWVVRNTEGFAAELPPAAVGKDWLGAGFAVGRAPSATGVTLSLSGFIGVTLAREEGLELHLLGETIGVDPNDLAIKLPALGKLSLL